MLKKKNPKIVVISPTITTNGFKQKEVLWHHYHLCFSVAEHQNLSGKHCLILEPGSEKNGG